MSIRDAKKILDFLARRNVMYFLRVNPDNFDYECELALRPSYARLSTEPITGGARRYQHTVITKQYSYLFKVIVEKNNKN